VIEVTTQDLSEVVCLQLREGAVADVQTVVLISTNLRLHAAREIAWSLSRESAIQHPLRCRVMRCKWVRQPLAFEAIHDVRHAGMCSPSPPRLDLLVQPYRREASAREVIYGTVHVFRRYG
jgi:hypothetical protein